MTFGDVVRFEIELMFFGTGFTIFLFGWNFAINISITFSMFTESKRIIKLSIITQEMINLKGIWKVTNLLNTKGTKTSLSALVNSKNLFNQRESFKSSNEDEVKGDYDSNS